MSSALPRRSPPPYSNESTKLWRNRRWLAQVRIFENLIRNLPARAARENFRNLPAFAQNFNNFSKFACTQEIQGEKIGKICLRCCQKFACQKFACASKKILTWANRSRVQLLAHIGRSYIVPREVGPVTVQLCVYRVGGLTTLKILIFRHPEFRVRTLNFRKSLINPETP